MTAVILTSLTRFAGLSVVGPLVQTNHQPIDYRKLRREYGAMFALLGWVRSYGTTIRITTDVIETPTGVSPWGRTFEYDLNQTSLFEIEDEVASGVAGVIADGLGIIFRKLRSESHRDYIKLSEVTLAVLAYNNAWETHAPEDWERANQSVSQALISHPDNALLVALQSNLYYADVLHGLDSISGALSEMEGWPLRPSH